MSISYQHAYVQDRMKKNLAPYSAEYNFNKIVTPSEPNGVEDRYPKITREAYRKLPKWDRFSPDRSTDFAWWEIQGCGRKPYEGSEGFKFKKHKLDALMYWHNRNPLGGEPKPLMFFLWCSASKEYKMYSIDRLRKIIKKDDYWRDHLYGDHPKDSWITGWEVPYAELFVA